MARSASRPSTSPERQPQRYLTLELLNGLRGASQIDASGRDGRGRERPPGWHDQDALIEWLAGSEVSEGGFAMPLPVRRMVVRETWDLGSAIERALHAFSACQELPEDALFTLNRALAAGGRITCLVADGPRVRLHEGARPWWRPTAGAPGESRPPPVSGRPPQPHQSEPRRSGAHRSGLPPSQPAWSQPPQSGPAPITGSPAYGPASVLAVLAPVALDCARLLATVDPSRLRICAAEDCGSWFLDTSKGGRRRWCSMRGCGNRAKAARHRRRRASG